jgi:hypothetical protein
MWMTPLVHGMSARTILAAPTRMPPSETGSVSPAPATGQGRFTSRPWEINEEQWTIPFLPAYYDRPFQ